MSEDGKSSRAANLVRFESGQSFIIAQLFKTPQLSTRLGASQSRLLNIPALRNLLAGPFPSPPDVRYLCLLELSKPFLHLVNPTTRRNIYAQVLSTPSSTIYSLRKLCSHATTFELERVFTLSHSRAQL
jgi:hypothetical protein